MQKDTCFWFNVNYFLNVNAGDAKPTFPLSSRFVVQNIQVPQLFQVYHASAQPIAAGEKLYYQSTIKLWISTHLI